MISEPKVRIAYFSMEVAADPRFQIYSGGLGVLAGDTLRSAVDLKLMQSCSRNKPEHVLIAGRLRTALDEHTARIAVLKRVDVAACAAQPEMLHGMSVRRLLIGRVIFVETKEQSLPIVKGCVAIRICAN